MSISNRLFAPTRSTWIGIVAIALGGVWCGAAFAADLPSTDRGVSDPVVAAKDADFLAQGEYQGETKSMQVIALGDGEMDLLVYDGPLPGSGTVTSPRRIEADIDTVADLVDSMSLERVERSSPTMNQPPPSGAIVLFDGTPETTRAQWTNGRLDDRGWLMPGTMSQRKFRDYSLHLEFRTPWMPTAQGQARGNSGVYHQGRYETQILDSFGWETANNFAGGIYGVAMPTINACRPPLAWQTYDVDFTAARYDESGKKTRDAVMTVKLNGVMVLSRVSVPDATRAAMFSEGPQPGPIALQDHGDAVRFRNIWVVPRDADREAGRPIIAGFERFHSDQASVVGGEILLSGLACNACHTNDRESVLPEQRGPNLTEAVGRIRGDALLAMIAQPHETKPGTTMPDPWTGVSQDDRKKKASAIASYLMLRGKGTLRDDFVTDDLMQSGETLFHTVGCAVCHGSRRSDAPSLATSVPLGKVDQKYSARSLSRFLLSPNDVRPGVRMPALVGEPSEAFAIAAYLVGNPAGYVPQSHVMRRVYRGKWGKLPDFESLTPVSSGAVADLNIDDIEPRNHFGVVFESQIYLDQDAEYEFELISDDGASLSIGGETLSHDGIHAANAKTKTFKLSAGIHSYRVEYFDAGGERKLSVRIRDPLIGMASLASMPSIDPDSANEGKSDLPDDPNRFQPDPLAVAQGESLFKSMGCVQCHGFDDQVSDDRYAKPMQSLEVSPDLVADAGCLAKNVRGDAVDFGLTRIQRDSIAMALNDRQSNQTQPPDDATQIHLMMAALNCYACHSRNKLGGPEAARDVWFETTTPEMGWEGRLPPSLDGVGDKLNVTYFATILQNGANERDYMKTRMPGYQYEPVRALHQAINRSDVKMEMESVPADQPAETVVANGRQLCGNNGLSCIKCHSFGGDKGGGIGAIDMLKMPVRLREEWFQRYLQDPIAYRPGTRMPNSFVDGKSTLVDMYGGDPARQINAMWKYLKQGDQAKDPEGLKQDAIALAADQRPRIYRNFFTDVTARGIAVAYPDKTNLIWDAETMTLAKAWRNSFIDASLHWQGRGQGRQTPLGDAVIRIDSATPIAFLPSIDAAWPAEAGRERGIRFLGYQLNSQGMPTFRYQADSCEVRDQAYRSGVKDGFIRKIQVAANHSEPLVWQIASGDIKPTAEGYRVNGLFNLSISGPVPDAEPQLLSVGGTSTLRVIIPPQQSASFELTYQW